MLNFLTVLLFVWSLNTKFQQAVVTNVPSFSESFDPWIAIDYNLSIGILNYNFSLRSFIYYRYRKKYIKAVQFSRIFYIL